MRSFQFNFRLTIYKTKYAKWFHIIFEFFLGTFHHTKLSSQLNTTVVLECLSFQLFTLYKTEPEWWHRWALRCSPKPRTTCWSLQIGKWIGWWWIRCNSSLKTSWTPDWRSFWVSSRSLIDDITRHIWNDFEYKLLDRLILLVSYIFVNHWWIVNHRDQYDDGQKHRVKWFWRYDKS